MDPINPIAGNPEALNATPEIPKKDNHGITVAALAVFILLSLTAVAFLYYQNQQLKSMLASYQTPATSPSPTTTTDPTADWKTYTNPVEKFSFKYAAKWTIDTIQEKGDERSENIQLKLTNDQVVIQIYANMVGVGGVGRNFDGTPVVIDGHTLYEYSIDNTYNNTKQIGITDSLEQSLGLFQIQGKTYSVTLTYPDSFTSQQVTDAKTEFNQILSTFKFLSPSQSPSKTPVSSSSAVPTSAP